MTWRWLLTMFIAAVLGALVWALSPWFTGHREPWDSESVYYLVGLAMAGALAGWLAPRPWWAHYLGALVGQALYQVFFLKVGPLFDLGLVLLAGYGLVFVAAAAAVGYVRTHLGKNCQTHL